MKIRELIEATVGIEKLNNVSTDIDLDMDVNISTDTRTIKQGDFYLPLKGASFDGEKFIDQAVEKGAVGTFCTQDCSANTFFIKVPDTLTAYLQLANYRRKKLNPIVVAINNDKRTCSFCYE